MLVATLAVSIVSAQVTRVDASVVIAGVIIAEGDVTAVDSTGNRRALQRRSEVYAGEQLVSGDNGKVQLRFIDGAVVALNCNSTLVISDYRYEESSDDRVELFLRRGRMRTITGAIEGENYKFLTDLGEVAVLGTDFEVAAQSDSDHYFGVYDGAITIRTEQGALRLGIGGENDFAHVVAGSAPQPLLLLPLQLGMGIAAGSGC